MSDFMTSPIEYNKTISMGEFNDTFNFIIGTSDETIDLLDNPYIQINIIDLDQEYKPKISENIFMRKCDLEKDLLKFMSKNVATYYPNAMCFNNKKDIKF